MEDGLAYGDPALVAAAPPVTFGLGTSALWDRGERELRRLGRRLAREGVSRVLVAGHADGTGTCAVNDALALARARAVAGALVRGGLPRRALTVVGLGARRPLDFATTPEADARNRRVEIFIPAPDPAPTSTEAPSGGS
jgi:adhesin transport system outer membrane protein